LFYRYRILFCPIPLGDHSFEEPTMRIIFQAFATLLLSVGHVQALDDVGLRALVKGEKGGRCPEGWNFKRDVTCDEPLVKEIDGKCARCVSPDCSRDFDCSDIDQTVSCDPGDCCTSVIDCCDGPFPIEQGTCGNGEWLIAVADPRPDACCQGSCFCGPCNCGRGCPLPCY